MIGREPPVPKTSHSRSSSRTARFTWRCVRLALLFVWGLSLANLALAHIPASSPSLKAPTLVQEAAKANHRSLGWPVPGGGVYFGTSRSSTRITTELETKRKLLPEFSARFRIAGAYARYSDMSGCFAPSFGHRFYSAGVWFHPWAPVLLTSLVILPAFAGAWRRRRRRDLPLCECCGYNLTGNESGICPECGEPAGDVAAT